MNFLSANFLQFLPVALVLWYATRHAERWRILLMIIASLGFYGAHRGWFIAIILAYCVVDWGVGLLLQKRPTRVVLIAGIAFNLGVLSAWKYTPMLAQTLAEFAGWPPQAEAAELELHWIVPLGVSFYAFSGIAYMVDVYRGQTRAEPDFFRYTLFTVFFPHLIAGPILRAREFLWHLEPGRLPMRSAPAPGSPRSACCASSCRG